MKQQQSSASKISKPSFFDELQPIIEEQLHNWLPTEDEIESRLAKAMRYSVFSGGKRVRPVLSLLSSRLICGKLKPAFAAACAVEFIHTYSLIHDDLPCMDDDDMRRGKPTNHLVFGQSLAVLAGDALQTRAFEVLGYADYSPERTVRLVQELSKAAGPSGMVGGQALDIKKKNFGPEELKLMHAAKTGALLSASVRMGAIAAGADHKQLEYLEVYGRELGLAFQIADDILDVIGDPEKTGRYRGSDEKEGKSTYPQLFGVDESKKKAREALNRGISALSRFGDDAHELVELLEFVVERDG